VLRGQDLPFRKGCLRVGGFWERRIVSVRNGLVRQAQMSLEGKWMVRLQGFQTAAQAGGFVKVSESEAGDVRWLRKSAADLGSQTHQRMSIDTLTKSVTVYRMDPPGIVNAKTFRAVPELQKWFRRPVEVEVAR
jgi:hypothetical protein